MILPQSATKFWTLTVSALEVFELFELSSSRALELYRHIWHLFSRICFNFVAFSLHRSVLFYFIVPGKRKWFLYANAMQKVILVLPSGDRSWTTWLDHPL